MSDSPNDWLEYMFKRLDERLTAHAAEMRLGFVELRRSLDTHAADDRDVANRVTRLEEMHRAVSEITKEVSQWHGAIYGTIAAGAVTGLIEALKRLFGPHP